MDDPNLNDLSVFVQVVNAGSFTAAARRIGTPPSTVSRRVARLEKRLGARLLHRTTRQLRLTDSGRRYYERGSRILEELEDAERELAELHASPRGLVRVAAPMEHSVTMALMSRFLVENREIRVELFLTNRLVNLVEDGYDVAIQPGELPDSTHLVAFKLMDSVFRLVASPSYLVERPAPERPEDLATHDCIVFGPSVETVWSLPTATGPVKIPVRGRLAVNHLVSVKEAAIAGIGIAMLPQVVCDSEIQSGSLRVVLPETPPPAVPVWVTYTGGRHISPAVRALVDFAKERFVPILHDLYRTASP